MDSPSSDWCQDGICPQQQLLQYKQTIMKTQSVGQDIIEYYRPYRNKQPLVQTTLNKHKFLLPARYTLLSIIGQGASGVVVAARDTQAMDKSKEMVAIKKIDKVFEHKIFAKRILRELTLLRLLKHENIINIETIVLPASREEFEDVYVVSELMDTDLAQIIGSKQVLTEEHYKSFLYQILRGLKFIHSAQIVHRDLKPRNLLVNQNCQLKICDFGLARSLAKSVKANVLTEYVATRWYRAPEILLSAPQYSIAADMWSVGCIFAEMLLRRTFLKGTDTKDQIQKIFEQLGTPDLQSIKMMPEESIKLLKTLPKMKKSEFSKTFAGFSAEAVDLLKQLLAFDPEKRITVEQALEHPFMADYHLEQDEPTRKEVDPLQIEFQQHNLTTQQYKDLLYEEILLYHSKEFYLQYEARRLKRESLISHVLANSNKDNINPRADSDD